MIIKRNCFISILLALASLGSAIAKPQTSKPSEVFSDAESSCVCVSSKECSEADTRRTAVTSRSKFCHAGEVCCLFNVESDLSSLISNAFAQLANTTIIVGTSDIVTSDIGTSTIAKDGQCTCIHEDQCEDYIFDIGSKVNVRSHGKCTKPFHICCNNPIKVTTSDIVTSDIGTSTIAKDDQCTCIHENQCEDYIFDIGSKVNVRSHGRCTRPYHICCSNPINETAELSNVTSSPECSCVPRPRCEGRTSNTETCIIPANVCCNDIARPIVIQEEPPCTCIHEDRCEDSELDLFVLVHIRTGRCTEPFHVCCVSIKGTTSTTERPSLPNAKPNCGYREDNPLKITNRVASGQYAEIGEFPWMVAIMRKNASGNYSYSCGGSLIHPSVVLTTAHCIDLDDGHIIKLRIGELDLDGQSEVFGHAKRLVVGKVLHPLFSRRSLAYDVGLLFMNEPVELSTHINTVCLPGSPGLSEYHKVCTASGWGKKAFGKKEQLQSLLKKVDLPLVSNIDCEAALRQTHLSHRFKLHHSFICAGGTGHDTCTGDGGSPLVCPTGNKNKYVQVGAVAWGIECGKIGLPGVYASIEVAREWIVKTVTDNYGPDSSKWFSQ